MYRKLVISLCLLDRQLWPSIFIALACVVGLFLPRAAFGADCPWWGCLLYHFSHANIFHLAINLWALFAFKPRWATCGVGFIAATLAAALPLSWVSLPTCGLSGFLMAAYARRYVDLRAPIWKVLALNMLFVFFPMFNWKVHVLSFLFGYGAWRMSTR